MRFRLCGSETGAATVHRFLGEEAHPGTRHLVRFLEGMTACVREYATEAEQVAEAERLLADLIQDSSWLRPEWLVPSEHGYARHPIYADPLERFEVLVLVWQPGQATLLHDHDGTWGAEGVIQGAVTITNFLQEGVAGPGLVRLRETETVVVRARETGQLLPPADCHIVANRGEELAVTIHVYGKPLRQFQVFRPAGAPGLYRAELVRVKPTVASAS